VKSFGVERLEARDLADKSGRVVVSGREDASGLLVDVRERDVGEALRDHPSADGNERFNPVADGEQFDQAVPGVHVDACGGSVFDRACWSRRRDLGRSRRRGQRVGATHLERLVAFAFAVVLGRAFQEPADEAILVDDLGGGVAERAGERFERREPDARGRPRDGKRAQLDALPVDMSDLRAVELRAFVEAGRVDLADRV
jgi:hypothetical protein